MAQVCTVFAQVTRLNLTVCFGFGIDAWQDNLFVIYWICAVHERHFSLRFIGVWSWKMLEGLVILKWNFVIDILSLIFLIWSQFKIVYKRYWRGNRPWFYQNITRFCKLTYIWPSDVADLKTFITGSDFNRYQHGKKTVDKNVKRVDQSVSFYMKLNCQWQCKCALMNWNKETNRIENQKNRVKCEHNSLWTHFVSSSICLLFGGGVGRGDRYCEYHTWVGLFRAEIYGRPFLQIIVAILVALRKLLFFKFDLKPKKK